MILWGSLNVSAAGFLRRTGLITRAGQSAHPVDETLSVGRIAHPFALIGVGR